jgi:hypothetical protein
VAQAKLTGATVDAVTAWHYPTGIGGYGLAAVEVYERMDHQEHAAKALNEAVLATPGAGIQSSQSSIRAARRAMVSHRVPGRPACPRRLYYTRYYSGVPGLPASERPSSSTVLAPFG